MSVSGPAGTAGAPAVELTDIQGVVTLGYRDLPLARMVLLQLGEAAAARSWLAALTPRVTSAVAHPSGTAVNVALTASGLAALGLPASAVAMLASELQQGMTADHRALVLGDVDESAPDRWRWGGPGQPRVDALLLMYAADDAGRVALGAGQADAWRAAGLVDVQTVDTVDLGRQEHFGFRDGISQPAIAGVPGAARPDDVVSAGEFVLGYPNEYGLYTDRPVLAADADPQGLLPPDPAGSGGRDLGRNGTYLVLRQLAQDVDGFRAFTEEAGRGADGAGDPAAAELLAAKMVGRWRSGAPLVLAPDHDRDGLADANEFRYHDADPLGQRCPIGSHVRRTNPRDSLDPQPGTDASVAVGKRHRLIRRGRSYGAPDGGGDRGLLFIGVCANIARQFEFIQHTWVQNPKFAGLYDDADPLLGVHRPHGGTFTIPARPVRRRVLDLPRFVTVRGGAYFFLPGLRALRYLAALHD